VDRLTANRRELAVLLGVSMPTIDSWVTRGLPVVQRGSRGVAWQFDVADCFAWRLDYEVAKAAAQTENVSLADAERRKRVADARLAEIELSERLRQVVRVEDTARLWEGRIVAARETLLQTPKRLAPTLVGEDDRQAIEETIEREIHRALEELAEWEPDEDPGANSDDSDADADAALE